MAVVLAEYELEGSMIRRGNCHDIAFLESFFQLLKPVRIKKRFTRKENMQELIHKIH